MPRAPDLTGAVARAWTYDPAKGIRHPDHHATVAIWLINGPFHPWWSWWMLGVVHLRPLPGESRPAVITLPGASHELHIFSLDPERSTRNPDFPPAELGPDFKGFPLLDPVDVVEQFAGLDDQQAGQLAYAAVQCICRGLVSPDSDYRSVWKELIAGTAEHYRSGQHKVD